MKRPRWSRRLLSATLAAVLTVSSVSCGTLLHPERRGQVPTGRLDPGIVLLDAAGLLLFLVPGLVAFAVDFSTGAIYLPPDYNWAPQASAGENGRPVRQSAQFVKLQLAKEELTRAKIESVVGRRTGHAIDLEPGQYRAERLSGLEQFQQKARRLAEPSDSIAPTQIVFP
ncbi:MAG TPA: hypothetical protein VL475_06160 [Planctomycetaceae bacterium]|nr:hypothetical protein [Planctomycetaceae bacterium]